MVKQGLALAASSIRRRSAAWTTLLDSTYRSRTSICIVDDTGKIVREVKVASEPQALLAVLKNPAYHFRRIGLEAGPLSQWLFSALAEVELPVVCVETRHMQAVLKAQINKTDRNDTRGIAQVMRVGLYRPVHVKMLRSQKLRMLLTHRKRPGIWFATESGCYARPPRPLQTHRVVRHRCSRIRSPHPDAKRAAVHRTMSADRINALRLRKLPLIPQTCVPSVTRFRAAGPSAPTPEQSRLTHPQAG